MGLRIAVSLVKCGRCGKRYSNPVTHECVVTSGRRRGRTRVRPRVSYDCPKCSKPVTNPLTHVCVTRTDFRQRLAAQKKRAAAEKRAKSRPAAQRHDYRSCRDGDCERRACMAYREGFEAGIESCALRTEDGTRQPPGQPRGRKDHGQELRSRSLHAVRQVPHL